MLPTLHLGPLAIPIPQLSMILALWLGLLVAEKYAPQRNSSTDALYNLVFTGLATGLLGARIGYVLQYPGAFIQSPISLISLNLGLFDTFSGMAFGIVGMFVYGYRAKLSFWNTLDSITPILAVLMIGLAIAHVASGESFGSETNLPWAINLWGAKRHPTQFYELIGAIIIFGLMLYWQKSFQQPGKWFLVFVALTTTAQLFLEAFHGDSTTIFGGIRTAQVIAWIVLATILYGLEIISHKT